MKNLTDEQARTILALSEYEPSIESTYIRNSKKSTSIDIYSVENASNNECDAALAVIFPEAEYGKTIILTNSDGSFYEYLDITVPKGIRVSLFMHRSARQKEEAPADTGAIREISLPEHSTSECEREVVAIGKHGTGKCYCFGKFVPGDVPCETSWCNMAEECQRVSKGVGAK